MNTVIHYRDIFFKYFHLVPDMTHKELEELKIQFGENLKRIRKAKKLSLLKLSYNCDLDESNISKIEHGKFNIT